MIQKLRALSKSFDELQPHGITEQELVDLSESVKTNLGTSLPVGYAAFLKEMNGFYLQDYAIFCYFNDGIRTNFPEYGNIDLVERNRDFVDYTDVDDFLLLGESSISYIAYEKRNNQYVLLSNGTLRVLESFDTFEALVLCFLKL